MRAAPSQRAPAQGVGVFCPSGAQPFFEAIIAVPARRFAGDIDEHRGQHGVEPICRVLPAKSLSGLREIAPSTYHEKARQAEPFRLPVRAKRDAERQVEIMRVFKEDFRVYGVQGVRQLRRKGFDVARCTVAWLMTSMGLAGAVRGQAVRTTVSDKAAPCPLDPANRQFRVPAPNMLWVSDFT